MVCVNVAGEYFTVYKVPVRPIGSDKNATMILDGSAGSLIACDRRHASRVAFESSTTVLGRYDGGIVCLAVAGIRWMM